jgi:serine/threonine protein kinase
MEVGTFLRLAVALSAAVGRLHERGLIHKDIKPANVLVNSATGQVWLTGFGIASRLPRERELPEPPEVIAGVTLYEMLSGSLPFTASDPMEWVWGWAYRSAARSSKLTGTILGDREHTSGCHLSIHVACVPRQSSVISRAFDFPT